MEPDSGYLRRLVASNDDSLPGSGTNSFIKHSVTTSDYYDIVISTSTGGETGDYTFAVSVSPTLSPYLSGSVPKASSRDRWWRDVGLPKRSRH
jgi:hypothetical protein